MEPKDQPSMNEDVMETLACQVCCQRYNHTDRCAIVLPCGHTFCSKCMKNFQKKCAQCRAKFLDSQVAKNYFVHTLLDQMSKRMVNNQRNIKQKEACPTHKREIDRFCKICTKLMCSVCQCEHLRLETNIMSDANLREEIQSMLKSYKDVEKTKKELNQRVDNGVETEMRKEEKSQAQKIEEISSNVKAKIKKVTTEKDTLIKEAEQDAKQKIQQIELNKINIIQQAIDVAQAKINKIESKAAILLEELNLSIKITFDTIRKTGTEMKQKIDVLQDLNKFKADNLMECVTIYKLEAQQKQQLQEFFTLSNRNIESMFKPSLNSFSGPKSNNRNDVVEKREMRETREGVARKKSRERIQSGRQSGSGNYAGENGRIRIQRSRSRESDDGF